MTAPLRRLGDRYASEVCVALCAGTEVPDWVHAALPDLPKTMQESAQRANRYERMVLDLVEAGRAAASRGGDVRGGRGRGQREGPDARASSPCRDPAVEAPVVSASDIPLGTDVRARLTTADVEHRKVEFTLE